MNLAQFCFTWLKSLKAFIPTDIAARTECLNWLFWQMGSAPYLGGGFGHFYAYAPVKVNMRLTALQWKQNAYLMY